VAGLPWVQPRRRGGRDWTWTRFASFAPGQLRRPAWGGGLPRRRVPRRLVVAVSRLRARRIFGDDRCHEDLLARADLRSAITAATGSPGPRAVAWPGGRSVCRPGRSRVLPFQEVAC